MSNQNQSDIVVNNEEMIIERNPKDWKMASVPINQIYKQSIFSKFSIKSDYKIKTFERTLSLNNENESIQLFNEELMQEHRQEYFLVNFGLVQVAIKPLIRQGLNTSVLLCLRDCRTTDFDESLIGKIETSLYEDPLYFNCFPNFTLPICKPNLPCGLTLDVKINNMVKGSQPLTIMYRICYELMKTLFSKSLGKNTSLIQTNARNSSNTSLIQTSARNSSIISLCCVSKS